MMQPRNRDNLFVSQSIAADDVGGGGGSGVIFPVAAVGAGPSRASSSVINVVPSTRVDQMIYLPPHRAVISFAKPQATSAAASGPR